MTLIWASKSLYLEVSETSKYPVSMNVIVVMGLVLNLAVVLKSVLAVVEEEEWWKHRKHLLGLCLR